MKPKENIFRTFFRKPIDKYTEKFPWPRINPNYVSYSTLITTIASIFFYLNNKLWLFWIFLLFTLILDVADGAIARKYGLESINGWWTDKIVDRISEIIITSVVWLPGLILVLLGTISMILSYKGKYPLILMFIPPLRLVLLIYYLIVLI